MLPSRPNQRLFFRDASQLLTLAGPPVPRRGTDSRELGIIHDGAVLTQGERILAVGATAGLAREARRLRAISIDCRGRVVMPGFVDSHTHLLFAGNRVEDFERRLEGQSYEEIARAGGGIRSSAERFREARPGQLITQAGRFLHQFAAHGTTTVEVKTGYGLDPTQELRALAIIRRLRERSPIELVPTLLAAHALPLDFRGKREAFLKRVIGELIPVAARGRLAEFVDCFCDRGAFSATECRRVLAAGARHGLVPRLHAEQLTHSGATRLAVSLRAASADHLDRIRKADLRALGRSDVVATLLPGANFHLGLGHYPPARELIDHGAAVALATDFNPGTSPTLNMQFILALACSQMRMMPAEALSAATINAAHSLRRADRLGSLEPGKQADLVVMDVADYREIPYYFAWNHCLLTVKRGGIIHQREHPRGEHLSRN